MKKHELVNTLAATLATKDGIQFKNVPSEVRNKYISTVLTLFTTLESLGIDLTPSERESGQANETMIDAIFQKWCDEFEITTNWPQNISLEERFDRYFFPQIHEYLNRIEADREYYQNRFYVMQWAFRKFMRTYGEVAKELEYADIQFISDDMFSSVTPENQQIKGNVHMDGRKRADIKPGAHVQIVQKQDQRSGKLTDGVVKTILTKSPTHPHGIKVRLESDIVGRVKEVLPDE